MTSYLIDTNVVMRFCNAPDHQHQLATDAIFQLLAQGDDCFLTAQVLVEFWVVATRPVEVNGLGWTIEQTRSTIDQLLDRFPLLEETPQIFVTWLNLVTANKVLGKRTHDIRLIAAMLTYEVKHLLTFNPSDFATGSGITIVRPQDLMQTEQN